jgi:hypothetical protein
MMRAPMVAVLVVFGSVVAAPGASAAVSAHANTPEAATRDAQDSEVAKAPSEILADATMAMTSAPVLLVQGTVQTDSGRVSLKIASGHGSGGGTVFLDGAQLDLVVASPNVYLRGTADSWTKLSGNPTAAALLGEKWVQSTTADQDFAAIAALTDTSGLASMLTVSGTLTKGRVTKFQGHKAIPLHDDGGSSPGTLYVAATGTPYPLGVVSDAAQAGRVVFSRYGKARIPAPPAQSVSMSQLLAAGA